MSVPVVALYGALNAILNVVLASRVSGSRMKEKVAIGTGGIKELELRARIHANNAEFVPLALVLLLIAELMGGASLWLHVLGGTLLVGRIMHVIGMPMRAPNMLRAGGVTLTWGMMLATSAWLLVMRFAKAG